MERKSFRAVNYKAAGDSDRVRTGIAAVFGNVDHGADITHSGAFSKTLSEGRRRFNHYWNHDLAKGPIASIIEIKEVSKSDLPAEILSYAPEATGGLLVKRDYYPKDVSPLAEQVLYAIDRGDLNEMSYGYDTVKADFSTIEGKEVRNLREVMLYDTSDVPLGMNPATLGSYKGFFEKMDLPLIAFHLQQLDAEIKAGRRHSAADSALLQRMLETVQNLLGRQQQPETATPESETAGADDVTPLSAEWTELERLELELLTI